MASKNKGPKGMILLAKGNRILEETVRDQIFRDPDEKKVSLLDVKLCDFDEVAYQVKIENGDNQPMKISIAYPGYHQIKDKADKNIATVYGDQVAEEASVNYDITLNIDLDSLPDDEAKKEELVKSISYLKYNTMCGPFRDYFQALDDESPLTEGFKFDMRSDTTVYFCPRDDRVTIVYAIDFQEKVDKTIGKIFMQELCDARKRVRTAPPFAWSVNPPTEIGAHGVTENPGILGYASLAVMTSHIKGKKKEDVIGALVNFRSFIQYHIKCAKSYFHSRMRARCSDLLKILNRAKVQFGVKVKKTKSGKTFKRS